MNYRLVKILPACIVLASTGVKAQSDIEEIVVEEKFFEETIPLELSRYGSRVEVITGEEIRRTRLPGYLTGPADAGAGTLHGAEERPV